MLCLLSFCNGENANYKKYMKSFLRQRLEQNFHLNIINFFTKIILVKKTILIYIKVNSEVPDSKGVLPFSTTTKYSYPR